MQSNKSIYSQLKHGFQKINVLRRRFAALQSNNSFPKLMETVGLGTIYIDSKMPKVYTKFNSEQKGLDLISLVVDSWSDDPGHLFIKLIMCMLLPFRSVWKS